MPAVPASSLANHRAVRTVSESSRDGHSGLRPGGGQQGGDAGGGEGIAAPRQAGTETLPRLGQPRRHRPPRAAQDLRGLLVRLAFEVTQHQGSAVPLGQSLEFLLQGDDQLARGRGVALGTGPASGGLRFALQPPGLVGADAKGQAVRDGVQPVPQRLAAVKRRGLAHQDEECGLEGILGGLIVVQHAAADAEDHRSVPSHQRLEGQLVALGRVTLEQLPLGQTGETPPLQEPFDLLLNDAVGLPRHGTSLPKVRIPLRMRGKRVGGSNDLHSFTPWTPGKSEFLEIDDNCKTFL